MAYKEGEFVTVKFPELSASEHKYYVRDSQRSKRDPLALKALGQKGNRVPEGLKLIIIQKSGGRLGEKY